MGLNPEPLELVIGDTVTWIRRSVQAVEKNDNNVLETIDIKASEGWTLKFTAVGKLGYFTITASADADNADDFCFTATAETTSGAGYVAGDYKWQVVAIKTTTRYTIAEGWITLLDNISGRTALYDNRSHAKKVLDAIEAVIEGRASQDQMSYSIAGRQLSRTPIPDLMRLRAMYKSEYDGEVATANIEAGLSSGNKIHTRFI